MLTGALAALVRELAADDELVDDVVSAARADFPEVARLPWTESRRHVSALLAAGFTAFIQAYDQIAANEPALVAATETLEDASGRTGSTAGANGLAKNFSKPGALLADADAGLDFSEATRFGAERAALGVPVAGLLAGVHAGRSRLLEIAITRGHAAGIPYDELLQALLRLDRYGTAVERHVMDGYRAAEQDLDRDDRTARIRVLRRFLLGEDTDDDPGRFGLRDGAAYHCVASDVADPGRVRVLEQVFARCGGVLAPVDGRLCGLTPRLPAGRHLDPSVLIVTTPPVPLAEARTAYRLCRTAVQAARSREMTGVTRVADLAPEIALAAQPMLAGFLSAGLLAALSPADEFHRQLVSTALAYLDNGQRLDLTAAALHLHPNTVRYRLRRLRELTDFDPDDRLSVLETLRWWWALHTWSGPEG